ncbi:hypothetical protein A9Q99_04945 [Gammaproteobacteria bacterium 45_16_T64]|nr:hypothetical protein A9Q99_04945 [Gammaproteobacteria bacterium 45_16_T64]
MKISVQVDAQVFEFVDVHDTQSIARNRVRVFHRRAELEGFISKAVSDNAADLISLANDPTVSTADTLRLTEALADRVENKQLFIQKGLGGSGAPKAASRPAIPGSNPLENVSNRYSGDMKRFIVAHQDNYERFGGIKREFLSGAQSPDDGTQTGAGSVAGANGRSSLAQGAAGDASEAFQRSAQGTGDRVNQSSAATGSNPLSGGLAGVETGVEADLGADGSAINTGKPFAEATIPTFFNSVASQKELHYKIVVEIAGRNPCPKQHIEIHGLSADKSAPRPLQAQMIRGVHHNRDRHRSIVEFTKLPNVPRELTLVVPTRGHVADIRLPLHTEVFPSDNRAEQPEWDNVLVPVKPLAYVTKANNRQEADVLKPGWVYIFWRGKLWRELQVQKNQALKDVNVEFYRNNWNGDFGQEEEREAEGHWQTAVWVPYKLNGELQTDHNAPLMMYSEGQLDWPFIESLENDNATLKESATALELSAYSEEQHYKNAAGHMGSIETALLDQWIDPEQHDYQVISNKGKDLRGYRDSQVPVVFLQPQGDFFMLEVLDEEGKPVRDKTFQLQVGDKQFSGELDRKGMLKFNVPEGIPAGGGKVLIWPEGEDGECEEVPFQVSASTMPDVQTIAGVQARCNNLGFDAGVVDGINGKKTTSAVKGFQAAYGLDVDGIAGPKTKKKLKQVYKR